ncbi:LAQU0S04e01684g1_1 [Lachancea quebecensis]|uniref:LAQU0S04e01684g1_1 n=1 Tax=Lachancea quebecensis TaxID=1654605 RepID=A0A0P1KZC0_9SACH|nr:LAQU0S04e01684g1_1 [Lachancea quebecensis]
MNCDVRDANKYTYTIQRVIELRLVVSLPEIILLFLHCFYTYSTQMFSVKAPGSPRVAVGKTCRERTIEDSLKDLEIFLTDRKAKKSSTEEHTGRAIGDSRGSGDSALLSEPTSRQSNCTSKSSIKSAETSNNEIQRQPSPDDVPFTDKVSNLKIPSLSRFFVIKSCRSEHIQISTKNGVWSSTELGNRRLSQAYCQRTPGSRIFLLFSVNGSGCFCGLAEMTSSLRDSPSNIWMDKKRYQRVFSVRWLIVRNVPNRYVRHYLNPMNDMKSVAQSRDTQEVPLEVGRSIVRIFGDLPGPPLSL